MEHTFVSSEVQSASSVLNASLHGYEEVELVGNILYKLVHDPAFAQSQNQAMFEAFSDERYGKEGFTLTSTRDVAAGPAPLLQAATTS